MFRFTIRDMLWLMVVLALGLAFWRESRLAQEDHRIVAGLKTIIERRGDFSGDRERLHKLIDLLEKRHIRFDRTPSGAVMLWEYEPFNPSEEDPFAPPKLGTRK